MHGIVLMELKKHVEESYGAETWRALQLSAGLPGRMYTAMGSYPDEDVLALVDAASAATGRTRSETLEAFGRFIVPDLVATYGFLIPADWDALDVIEHTEHTIHTVVRARDGGTPPALDVTRVSGDRVSVRYTSERRLCALAKGIVHGVGEHFGTPLDVHEATCMLDGAPSCRLDVSRVRVVPPAPRTSVDGSSALR